jgi:hypothetical protein
MYIKNMADEKGLTTMWQNFHGECPMPGGFPTDEFLKFFEQNVHPMNFRKPEGVWSERGGQKSK